MFVKPPEHMTVSQLVELIRELVEDNFVTVSVEGEVSNLARPSSGHWYFTLKDSRSQLRAVMFRGRNRLIDSPPRDGQRVVCRGALSVYSARGELQLVVDELDAAGVGDLQQAFQELKGRLAAEGLFDPSRKKSLPAFPRTVGIVTSPTGAVIHDILNVLRRRAPGLRLLLCPVKVQGQGAAEEIAAAIDLLSRHGESDVLVVGRGGGSLEDLWAFNEEVVARAIVASRIPVISAVGHEVDVTISDLVADLRAPTPSAAAELVAKSRLELEAHLDHLQARLQSYLRQTLDLLGARLDRYELQLKGVEREFTALGQSVSQLQRRLEMAMESRMRHLNERLAGNCGRLDALSPLQQLARGYAIVSRDPAGHGLRSIAEVEPGQRLWIRLSDGQLLSRVEEVEG
ncbi:MAG: exodeoxyribonuclease VII large subunit [Desulfuromonas sp.]|nr:MAG: exodeoxyribonuclease VII large subunit [Desulfuromonas sp.]